MKKTLLNPQPTTTAPSLKLLSKDKPNEILHTKFHRICLARSKNNTIFHIKHLNKDIL